MKRHWDRLVANWARDHGYNGVLWGIAGKCLWDGSGYLSRGNNIAQSPTFYVLKSIPWVGIKAHGAVMLLFALLIVYSTAVGGCFARRVLIGLFLYSDFVFMSFIVSWYHTKSIVWSSPSSWFLIAHICLWCASTGYNNNTRGGDER